jgi:hypothetical protein
MRKMPITAALLSATALFAAACSNDDSSGGHMKLAVTDAPVDGADHVVVAFTGVELTGDSGPIEIDFATPKTIDLVSDSGTASAVLFDAPVPAGHYGQIRLKLQEPIAGHSFMHLIADDSTHPLDVPSGSETGLKLVSGFDVPDSGVVDYTIDFDLRHAITCPPGHAPNCTLKPAMRLVADNTVGNIAGTIAAALTSPEGCTPGVYLYSGNVATPADNSTATGPNQPIASKVPVTGGTGTTYQFTFLPPGPYSVAYTCDAANDDPDTADAVTFSPVVQDIAVTAGQTTTVNLPPAP